MSFIPLVGIKDDTSINIDLFSRLLKDRSIMLTTQINSVIASSLVAQMLHLEAENNNQDIYFYINSPGGCVTSTLAIYDVMQFIKARIITICFGEACSGASLLLCAGEKRMLTKYARVLMHQPSGGAQGQATDLEIQIKEIMRMKSIILDIYTHHTLMKREEIANLIERDYIMEADEAISRGIADEVLSNRRIKLSCKMVATK